MERADSARWTDSSGAVVGRGPSAYQSGPLSERPGGGDRGEGAPKERDLTPQGPPGRPFLAPVRDIFLVPLVKFMRTKKQARGIGWRLRGAKPPYGAGLGAAAYPSPFGDSP